MANGLSSAVTYTATSSSSRHTHTMLRGAPFVCFCLVLLNAASVVGALSEEYMASFVSFQDYFEYVGWLLIVFISLFGICANIMNIRIYRKMGLKESVNILFYSIACSDLSCCFFGMFYHLFRHPWFRKWFMEYLSLQIWELPGVFCYIFGVMFIMSSSMITAYMALQRCLCVAIPMKVKTIFTPRRTKISIACIVSYCVLTCLPIFSFLKFDWVYVNDTVTHSNNGSVSVVSYHEWRYFGRVYFESVYRQPLRDFVTYNEIFVRVVVNVTIFICTVILLKNLVSKSRWRKEAAADSGTSSKKEFRVVKTVVLICTLYVVCSFPNSTFLAIFLADPGFRMAQANWSPYHASLHSFLFIVTSVGNGTNVPANIVIYYWVSGQYREVFDRMFSFHRRRTDTKDVPK